MSMPALLPATTGDAAVAWVMKRSGAVISIGKAVTLFVSSISGWLPGSLTLAKKVASVLTRRKTLPVTGGVTDRDAVIVFVYVPLTASGRSAGLLKSLAYV